MDSLRNSDRDVDDGNGPAYTMGGFIHILLVLAVVSVAIQLINGRRLAETSFSANRRALEFSRRPQIIEGRTRGDTPSTSIS